MFKYDGYILTYTGKRMWFMEPTADMIDIEDIAHALSLECRFGGHVREFSSVAQHSVAVSHVCDPQDAFAGLMHDATEAYLRDMPSPIKERIAGYRPMEDMLWSAIAAKYGLPEKLPDSVLRADSIMLATEARDLCHNSAFETWVKFLPHQPLEQKYVPMPSVLAKDVFLARFYQLCPKEFCQ